MLDTIPIVKILSALALSTHFDIFLESIKLNEIELIKSNKYIGKK